MLNILSPILPMIFLICLGRWFRQVEYFSKQTVAEIKKFLLNICTPITIINMTLLMKIDANTFLIITLSYIMLCLFLIGGKIANVIPFLHNKLNPYVSSGTAFMLVGMSLFTVIYGTEHLATFALIGIGHEFFIWTIYYPLFYLDTQGRKITLATFKNLLSSPFIIALILGIILNAVGAVQILESSSIGNSILELLTMISSVASPLLLIVLGYGLVFEVENFKLSLKLVLVRFSVVGLFGLLFKFLVIDFILKPNLIVDLSFYAYLALPLMFTLTLFVEGVVSDEEVEIINGAIGISTIVSIILLIILSVIIPPSIL
ncbi:MAG: hypothetical protein ATN31_01710 [Candidatus Epulonipiscioides saccharophilum]|nr:MAG: hypothetical protein ATN31_01710 [Epulopiscium sp. AS2M-Bin001]